MDIPYICPNCSQPLRLKPVEYVCNQCTRDFQISYGIPNFKMNQDYYWSPIGRDHMQTILNKMEQSGWKAGLEEILDMVSQKTREDWLRNILFNGRTAWRFLLDIPTDGRALDYGCGWGSISLNLAKMFREVVSFDMTLERLQFLRSMAEESGVDNLTYVCGGDTPILPFPSGFFDVVALNGVLEWIPTNAELPNLKSKNKVLKGLRYLLHMFGDSNPKKIQKNALKEVNRILKPSGQLYLAIENRYGYEYFLGKPDNHSNLLFGSLLPRIAAHIYSLVKNHVPYRTYTYSYNELNKMLSKAQFTESRFYSMIPNYRDFNKISDLTDNGKLTIDVSAEKSRIKKKILNSSYYKFIAPSFGIVAPKSSYSKPFINSLIEDILHKIGKQNIKEHGTPYLRKFWVSGKDVAILKMRYGSNRGFIVRLPLSSISSEQVSANSNALKYFHADVRIPQHLKSFVPKFVLRNTFRGQPYHVEELKSGIDALGLIENPDVMDKIMSEVMAFIVELHSATKTVITFDEKIYGTHLENLIKRVRVQISGRKHTTVLSRVEERLKERLIGQEIPMVFTKGDCSIPNILLNVHGHRFAALIDWDESEIKGFPLIDVISLLESRLRNCLKVSSGKILTEIIFSKKFNGSSIAHIQGYMEALSIPTSLFKPFAIIYWLSHIAYQRYEYVLLNKRWLQGNLYDMLDFLDEQIMI